MGSNAALQTAIGGRSGLLIGYNVMQKYCHVCNAIRQNAFDMRLMQYTLARHSTNAKRGGDEVWFDMLTDIGVVGKARLAWEKNMEAEIEAEISTPSQVGSVVVASGECGNSDDDVSESSEDYIAEEIVGHVGGNKSRKYIVRWQGYAADDTSEEPARKFGTLLPIELLVKYLSKHPSAKQGHPGHTSTLKSLNS